MERELSLNSLINSIIQESKNASFKALSRLYYQQKKELGKCFETLALDIKKVFDSRNKQGSSNALPMQACKVDKKNFYFLLMQLYAKYKIDIQSSNMKEVYWEKIVTEIKRKNFKYNESECRIIIEDLKNVYKMYKMSTVSFLQLIDLVDTARNAIDIVGYPESSLNLPVQECVLMQKKLYELLLKLYVKYKADFCSSKNRRKRAWKQLVAEIQVKSPFKYNQSECCNMLQELQNNFQNYKTRRITNIRLIDFLDEAGNAFKNTKESGYSMTKTCSDSVENSKSLGGDANKVELFRNKSSNVQGNKVNSNPSMKKVTPSRGSHQITIQRNRHEVIANTAAKLNDSVVNKKVKSFCLSENETKEDNDDIIICTPPRQKIPPLIDLDNDLEFGIIPLSNTSAMKSASCSTSVDFHSEENFNFRINLDGDCDNIYKQTILFTDHILHEDTKNNEKKGDNVNVVLSSKKSDVGRKRKFNSNNSNDDYNKTENCVKKPAFIGPIQSSSYNSTSNLQLTTSNNKIGNLEKEDFSQTDSLPFSVECNSKDSS